MILSSRYEKACVLYVKLTNQINTTCCNEASKTPLFNWVARTYSSTHTYSKSVLALGHDHLRVQLFALLQKCVCAVVHNIHVCAGNERVEYIISRRTLLHASIAIARGVGRTGHYRERMLPPISRHRIRGKRLRVRRGSSARVGYLPSPLTQ